MKKTFYSLLAFGFLLAGISKSSAQTCTIDQSYLGSNTLQTAIGSNTTVPDGQSFRAGLSGVLNAVSLDISASNPGCLLSTMNVKVDILNGDGINGAVLASQVFNIPTTLTRTLYSFNFSSPAVVSSSQLYTIIITLLPGQNCGSGEPQLIWYFNFPTSFWSATGGRQYQDGIVTSLGNTQYFNTCVGPDLAAALNFDGVNDNVNIGTSLGNTLTGTNKITAEAWVKPTTTSGPFRIIVGNYSTPLNQMQFCLRQQGTSYSFFIGNGSLGSYSSLNAVNTVTTGVWQHVAGTWDGSIARIYVNGVLTSTASITYPSFGVTTNSVIIGTNTVPEPWSGDIDEVRIWNVTRTQCEINTFKNCEIPTTSTGLLANYHFNQGINAGNNASITTLIDASASAYTGTITGMPLTGATSNWVSPGGVTSGSVTPANLTPTVSSTVTNSVICSGNSTTLSGTGANTYVWTNGVTNAAAFTPTVTNTYTVTGTNTLTGCTNTAVSSVTVNALPSVAANITNVLCNGGAGSATVIAKGGASPYGFLASNGSTLSVQSGLMPGSYNYTVTDANSCVKTQTLSITEPTAIVTSSAITNAFCNGGTGSATVTATGGTGSYSYLASNGSTLSTQSSLLAGSYTYTITDANACTKTQALTITQPSAIVTTSAVTNVLCNGGTGSASVTATGGTGSYSYLASNGATVSVQSGLMAGSYTYTITDANACTKTQALTITQPSAIVTTSAVTNVLCNGGTGSASVTATGGTGAYSYLASNGATVSVQSGLMAGTYNYTVTDANACEQTQGLSITEPTAINLSSSASNATICAGASSTLTANATGGTGALTYTWVSGPTSNVNTVTPTTTAVYTVDVTDLNNCAASSTVEVTVNTLPVITAVTNNTLLCTGETATLTASGTATTYTWSTTDNTTTVAVSPTVQTTYTVNGTDANGCVNSTTVTQDVSACTGIVTLSNSNASVNVYPNPNNGLFVLELTTVSKVTVTNALGQVVITETMEAGKHNLDIQNEATGVYFVKVIENNNQHIIKVVKQ